jgi:hypothetical protein
VKFDPDFVEQLIREGIQESRTHDYKRELYGKDDRQKHELLKDVSAFANTVGGQIIIGVGDAATPFNVEGITLDQAALDAEKRRMQQILSARLEPRLDSISFETFEVDGQLLLVIVIPASNVGPHRVKSDDKSWFYVRTGSQVEAMDMRQIRQSFLATQSIYDSARGFRAERIASIEEGRAAWPLVGNVNLVAHAIPLKAGEDFKFVSADEFPLPFKLELYEGTHIATRHFNFDGAVYLHDINGSTNEYAQVFRNGAIEVVKSLEAKDGVRLSSEYTKGWLIGSAYSAVNTIRNYHQSDVALLLAVCGVSGMMFGSTEMTRRPFDRPNILLPETIISNQPKDLHEMKQILLPALNVLYQAAGFKEVWDY